MSKAEENARHFYSTLIALKLRIGISPVSTLVLPIGERVSRTKEKSRHMHACSFCVFSRLPLHPVPFWMHPNRICAFGGEEVIETFEKIFITIVLAHTFPAHPNVHAKVLQRFR